VRLEARIEEIACDVHGVDQAALFWSPQPHRFPAVHFTGMRQRPSKRVVGYRTLHPAGEDFGDRSVVFAIEHIFHPPEVERVVPVEKRPNEPAQILTTVGVRIFPDTFGDAAKSGFGSEAAVFPMVDLCLRLKPWSSEDHLQQLRGAFRRRLPDIRVPRPSAKRVDRAPAARDSFRGPRSPRVPLG